MNSIKEQRFGYEGPGRSTDEEEEAECRLHRLWPSVTLTLRNGNDYSSEAGPRRNFELSESAKRTGGGAQQSAGKQTATGDHKHEAAAIGSSIKDKILAKMDSVGKHSPHTPHSRHRLLFRPQSISLSGESHLFV